jgi:predicted dehydrogenase
MADKVRLAMIGCGGMAGGHLWSYQVLHEKGMRNFEIVACVDTNEANAQKFADTAEKFQGKRPAVLADYEDLLSKKIANAADIATPHGLHHIIGCACLESGVDVLIEKPIGITVRASRVIAETADRTKRIAATAENIRRGLGQRTIRWAIQDKKIIGEMRSFFSQGACYSPFPGDAPPFRWRIQKLLSGGLMVMDSGAHFVDSLRYFFGDLERAYAELRLFEPAKFTDEKGNTVVSDCEDSWSAILTFKSGLVGTWSWSNVQPGHDYRTVLYYGTEGSIKDTGDVFHGFQSLAGEVKFKDGKTKSINDLAIEFLLGLSKDEKERLFPYGLTNGVTLECWDFVDACANRRKPEIDAWDGLKAKAISETVYESAAAGKAIAYDDVVACKVEKYQGPINRKWGLVEKKGAARRQ